MDTVSKHHIRHKGSRIFYGLGVLLLSLSPLTADSQSVSTSTSDVAVLIQIGHSATPNRIRAHHREKNSFLQTWDGGDVRLWRRVDTTEQWRLFRHWKNMDATWSHKLKGELAYIGANVDGMFELYDAHNYELLYRISANMPVKNRPSSFHIVSGDSGRVVILRLRELDSQDREFYSLHLAIHSQSFAPWQLFPGNPRITGFSELGDGLFGAQTGEDKLWQIIRVDASGKAHTVHLSGLPTHLPEVRKLQNAVFGVALYDDALRVKEDTGATWHLSYINSRGEIMPIKLPGLEPNAIKDIRAVPNSKDFIRLVERGSGDDEALLTRFYWVDDKKNLRLAHQAIPGLPDAARNFRVLAKDRVVGATEVDDANENGIPGDWAWRVKDISGDWRSPHDLLPGLKGEIWRMVDFLHGEGLGVQTLPIEDGSSYRWHWYLHESSTGHWQAIDKVLPLPHQVQINFISDRDDNLDEEGTYIKLVATPDEPPSTETESPVPVAVRNVHYMILDEDGEWTAVRNLVAQHHPGREEHILAVNALRNGLIVDIQHNADEPPVHLFFYKNRDRQWVPLDNVFLATAGRTVRGVRPFPKVQRSEVLANDHLVLLHEQRDANWDGIDNDTQLLQAGDEGWRILRAKNALGRKADQLSYEPNLGLLVRTTRTTGEKHFFYPNNAGNWIDIRSMVPEAPVKISSAFVFADGRGLGVKELFDSNDNGRFGERFFYYRDGELWQDIGKSLPKAFPVIQTIISGGGRSSISVQEADDANGNGLAHEWRHYYRRDDAWGDLKQRWPDIPNQLSELWVSADGRVLTIREEWDANENDLPFELFAGVWSDVQQDFVPISSVIPALQTNNIVAIRSLWNGRGLAINMPSTDTTAGVKFRAGDIWHLYQHQEADRWKKLQISTNDLVAVRGDAAGRLLALQKQGSDRWELWTRKVFGSDFVRWQGRQPSSSGLDSLKDIRLNIAKDLIALKTHDLWIDREERWKIWRQDGDSLSLIGHSATPTWFGLDHHADSQKRIRFDNASHYLDGRQVDNVSQPAIWFHGMPSIPSQENILYAPDIITQTLAAPDGTSPPIRVDALGYGPDGTVVIYQIGGRRLVVGFSNGPVWMETRSLFNQNVDTGHSDLMLLMNQLPDGTERLVRLDAPDRWIWSYRHKGRQIYYDDNGYFFNETNAASEILTFRVGMKVYSFAQLGSYLFRPDLLEKHLDLPERSLFELTPRDADRIEFARKLAPEGVDISNLQPPHIKVLDSAKTTDEPFVELTVIAEGYGIDKTSITARILGAGQARSASVPLRSRESTWQRLRIVKKVSLLPGENRLEITVFDATGLSHSQRLDVTFKSKEERKPTLYVAVVATAQYKTNSLSNLPLTQKDAHTITTAFNKQSGKRFNKVVLHTWCQQDDCDSQPIRQNLFEELPNFLAEAQDGDYIVLYVSGHGLKIGNEYFMIPADGDPKISTTLVAWSEIRNWLSSARLGKKIVLFDTCHSGAVFQHGQNRRRLVQQAAEDDGIYVLSAAAADAAAYEVSSLGNGVFTYIVQQGLEGPADMGDGVVSFEELAFYVARGVRQLSSARRIRMEPNVPILNQDMDFPLADVNSLQQLSLRVLDESSFDHSALPRRVAWWKNRIKKLDSDLSVMNRQQTGIYELAIIEKDGEPIRGQLSISGGEVLDRWHFSEISVEDMLSVMVKKLRASTKHPVPSKI